MASSAAGVSHSRLLPRSAHTSSKSSHSHSVQSSSLCNIRARRKLFSGIRASSGVVHEERATRTEPLTKKELVDCFSDGCKPKDKWRVGTEYEMIGFDLGTLKPLGYEQIARLLEGMAGRFNWDRIQEDGLIVGLLKDGKSVTLEGGGQVELSGTPFETLHQTQGELHSYFVEVKSVADALGLGLCGIGINPKWPIDAFPLMPKKKCRMMLENFPKVGSTGNEVLLRACSTQVNMDFSSEEDMINKLRVALALQPIAVALFANSPFADGKPSGLLSHRSELYKNLDNNRTGILPFVFDDDFGFERYVEYALNVPMYWVHRNNHLFNCWGMSFKDFIVGKLPNLPGEKATLKDWESHIATIYTEVKLKKYLEMRGADIGPWSLLCAVPAFWVGLLYDDTSLQAALDLIHDWTPDEHLRLRNQVPTLGLKTPFRDSLLKHVAQDVVNLAKEGLQRRSYGEVHFLDEVVEIANTGVTHAERLLELYRGSWKESVDPAFELLRFY